MNKLMEREAFIDSMWTECAQFLRFRDDDDDDDDDNFIQVSKL